MIGCWCSAVTSPTRPHGETGGVLLDLGAKLKVFIEGEEF